MRRQSLLVLLTLLAGVAHADQVYRWRDDKGAIHYTDTAPPTQARDTERKRMGDRPPAPTLPYALQLAQRNFPVTLFIANGCKSACAQARSYLSGRGVPHIEKNASEETGAQALAALSGGKLEVPLLVVGKTVLRGFHESAWASTLDSAGYPKSSILPPGVSAKRESPKAAANEAPKAAAADPAQPATEAPEAQ
ncbi:MAG TPA: glutaredoxin family protein [Burkholderiales bacterium]|nr:glutaredoxin family protein [Burkholderiales bacterium]